MNLFENIKSSISSVFSHKMRSLLTMLGIIIGIASVIMITSIGEGARAYIFEQVESYDQNLLEVGMRYDGTGNIEDSDFLTLDDVDIIQDMENIEAVIPISMAMGISYQTRDPEKDNQGILAGTNENYYSLEEYTLLYGRFISEDDVESAAKVIVLNENNALEVFATKNCVGNTIELTTYSGIEEYTVIGVTKVDKDAMPMGSVLTVSIGVVPITTILDLIGQDIVNQMAVSLLDSSLMDQTSQEIYTMLSVVHDNKDRYAVSSVAAQMEEMDVILNVVTIFVSGVAAISLVVAGIGVMNIMLVSVTERTREIGIRKALGATDFQIQFQFLAEAVILTLIGGGIGIVFGVISAHLITDVIYSLSNIRITAMTTFGVISLAFSVSAGTGILFGVYPARKAAMLNPIDALRYE